MLIARRLPAILTLLLLAAQVFLVWSGPSFPSQDGRAHAYTGHVLRHMLLDSNSHYAQIYEVNRFPVPNWTTAAYFAVAGAALPPARAEQVLATLTILLVFASLWYLQTSLAGERTTMWPGLAALAHTWFLYMGFYNFLLGTAMALFLIGYYARRRGAAVPRHYIVLAALNVLAYFTHPMAQVLALGAVGALWVQQEWTSLLDVLSGREANGHADNAWKESLGRLFVALTPGTALLLAYVILQPMDPLDTRPAWEALLQTIAPLVFMPIRGVAMYTTGIVICVLLLALLLISAALWRAKRWNSAAGIVAGLALAAGVVYFFAPDSGAGGLFVTPRLAWLTLCLGSVAAGSVAAREVRGWFVVMSAVVAAALAVNLWHAHGGLQQARVVVAAMQPATNPVTPGCGLVRLMYPAPQWERGHNLRILRFAPTLHEPSRMAVERNCIDWTAYQPREGIFPVAFRKDSRPSPLALFAFEDPGAPKLTWLLAFLAERGANVDHVLVVGELPAADSDLARTTPGRDLRAVLELLESQFELAAQDTATDADAQSIAIRLYRKR